MNNLSLFKNRKTVTALLFFTAAILLEIITFLLLGFGLLPEYLVLDIACILIVTGISLLFRERTQVIFSITIISAQALISYVNCSLFFMFRTVSDITMLNLMGEATKAMESSVVNIFKLVVFVSFIAIYVTVTIILYKKSKSIKSVKTHKTKKLAFVLSLVLICQVIGISSYNIQTSNLNASGGKTILSDDNYLYDTLFITSESLKRFGTYTFYFRNFIETCIPSLSSSNKFIADASEYIVSGEKVTGETATSKDKNLIVIMAETLDWIGVDEELTPTLYSFLNEEVTLTNYYSKSKTNFSEQYGIIGNSSPSFRSFLPSLTEASPIEKNDFSYSLPNRFSNLGYENINYFINHEIDFYSRDEYYKNFGFENLYDASSFVDSPADPAQFWGDWSLDSTFVNKGINTLVPEQEDPFFTWFTTMSMHGPWEGNLRLIDGTDARKNADFDDPNSDFYDINSPYYIGNYNDYLNREEDATTLTTTNYNTILEQSNFVNPLIGTEFEDEAEYYENYLMGVMDLDRAIKDLLDAIEEKGLTEDTTIMIYGDHQAYYYDMKQKVIGVDPSEIDNPAVYRVPVFIIDSDVEAQQIDEFACPYDLSPTIFDLFGMEYNENIYMGDSFLSLPTLLDEAGDPVVRCFISPTDGLLNDKLFTTDGVNFIYYLEEELTDEYIAKFEKAINTYVEKSTYLEILMIYNLTADYTDVI